MTQSIIFHIFENVLLNFESKGEQWHNCLTVSLSHGTNLLLGIKFDESWSVYRSRDSGHTTEMHFVEGLTRHSNMGKNSSDFLLMCEKR